MKTSPKNFRKAARQEVAKREQINYLVGVSKDLNDKYDKAMSYYGDIDSQIKARDLGREIRDNSLGNLVELLERFEVNASLNGAKVLWAKDSDEACRIIGTIIEQRKVRTITRSKSTIAEEIKLDEYIKSKTRARIYHSDLGGFIMQQYDASPSHMLNPAINVKKEEVVEILHRSIGMPKTDDINEIAGFVADYLKDKFQKADMGITGVNQAVASTGSLLFVENEGDIRWSTSAPRIHVALMSIEKVCDNFADAFYLMELLNRNSIGQPISSYLSIVNGPKATKEKDAPEESYIILLDNGRSKAYVNDEFRDLLRCINCGRCAFRCPVYLRIGGYPYGNPYPGPKGTVLMPFILGLDETKHLYQACTLCGACEETCPVGVPHLNLIKKHRELKVDGDKTMDGTTNVWNKMLAQSYARAISMRPYYERGLIGLRAYFNSYATGNYISNLPGPMQSWFLSRDFPEMPAETFRDYWEKEGSKVDKEGEQDG
ncbi:MAG TPA: lactate utilization protein B [Syntrophomonadaceae bacterium]|nr:lactate utilization protein B [Syntrophomonadaceae bacterium]